MFFGRLIFFWCIIIILPDNQPDASESPMDDGWTPIIDEPSDRWVGGADKIE